MRWVLVFVGGGLGSAGRYLMALLAARWLGAAFPWGTFAVNVAGGLLIGFIATAADEQGLIGAQTRLFLVTGVLGGFTTFSSFSLETLRLAVAGQPVPALLNVLGNVTLALAAAAIGAAVARTVLG